MPKRIAVVGGGITGLMAAYDLERLTSAEIHLFEAAGELGGKIQTRLHEECLIEEGPDCFFSRKPGVLELVTELGIEGELIAPTRKQFKMLVDGKLWSLPGGVVTLTHLLPDAIQGIGFLSEAGKARALAEAEQPRGESEDESIQSFFVRRFGAEFSSLVVEPLLAGTYGGDADRLSMRSLFPAYLNLERKNGSLNAGMAVGTAPKESGTPTPSFLSFKAGMGTLVSALATRLSRTNVQLNSSIGDLAGWNHVLVAIPAPQAASLLPGIGLEIISHRSARIVTVGFDRCEETEALDGTGFLVPAGEPGPLSGVTWTSGKWPGRGPEAVSIFRLFLRDGVTQGTAVQALQHLLGLKAAPLFSIEHEWKNAMPQYLVGHLDQVAAIEQQLPPDVTIAGTSYRGIGIPDCLNQGRNAARRIAKLL